MDKRTDQEPGGKVEGEVDTGEHFSNYYEEAECYYHDLGVYSSKSGACTQV